MLKDFRFAWRGLAKSPAFVFVAVLTLALAIGANTAILSLVNALLVRPLPYRAPERLHPRSGGGVASQFRFRHRSFGTTKAAPKASKG